MNRLVTLLGTSLLLAGPAAAQSDADVNDWIPDPPPMADGDWPAAEEPEVFDEAADEVPPEEDNKGAPEPDQGGEDTLEATQDGRGTEAETPEAAGDAGAEAAEDLPADAGEGAVAEGMEAPAEAPPAPFGLDDLLGLTMGMPLEEAVAILRRDGFRPQAARANGAIESAGQVQAQYPRSATGAPPFGIVVNRAILPTRWGNRAAETHATVFLQRSADGVTVTVELTAGLSDDAEVGTGIYGTGRVFGFEVFQDYGDVAEPVGWLQIEARLREAAQAAPTCEEFTADQISMVWIVENGMARAPQGDYAACSAVAYETVGAASSDAVIGRALEENGKATPALPGSLLVQVSPHPTQGWVWMQRMEPALGAEVIGAVVQDVLELPPAPVVIVEY